MILIEPIHLKEDLIKYVKAKQLDFADFAKAAHLNEVGLNNLDNGPKYIIFIRMCSFLNLSFDWTLTQGKSVPDNLRQALKNQKYSEEETLKQIGIYEYFKQKHSGRFVLGFSGQAKRLNQITLALNGARLDDIIKDDYYRKEL